MAGPRTVRLVLVTSSCCDWPAKGLAKASGGLDPPRSIPNDGHRRARVRPIGTPPGSRPGMSMESIPHAGRGPSPRSC